MGIGWIGIGRIGGWWGVGNRRGWIGVVITDVGGWVGGSLPVRVVWRWILMCGRGLTK